MEEIGVIVGYVVWVVLDKLGSYVVVFFEIMLGSYCFVDFCKFEQGVVRYVEIVECYNVSGGYDYLFKIVLFIVVLFQELMECLLEDEIGIEKFVSCIVLWYFYEQWVELVEVIVLGKSSWKQ